MKEIITYEVGDKLRITNDMSSDFFDGDTVTVIKDIDEDGDYFVKDGEGHCDYVTVEEFEYISEEYKSWECIGTTGKWEVNEEYFNGYQIDLEQLKYNFTNGYKYYIGKTPSGFEVVWRTKDEM